MQYNRIFNGKVKEGNDQEMAQSERNSHSDDLKTEMTKMDLSRYQNCVLHVGGHDIDAKISRTSFEGKYLALIRYIQGENCKVFV